MSVQGERKAVAITGGGSANIPYVIPLIGSAEVSGSNPVPVTSAAASSSAVLNASNTVYATGKVIKASPGILYGLSGYNSGPAQFILLYDSTTIPADAAQAVVVIAVPTMSNFFYNPGPYGRSFATGISVSNSSTAPAKTVGAADCFVDAQYV